MIDLHVHSTYSDGSLTPAELVARATEMKLAALALTDHDTTAGVAPFLAACARSPVKGISGVELSVDFSPGTMHMLGYFVDLTDSGLQQVLAGLREGRDERNAEMLRKLNDLGLALTLDEVLAFATDAVVGRPHFAHALVAKGYVSSFPEAFDRYLAKGKPAYCERLRLGPEALIAAVAQAGGLAVLAHPFTLELAPADLRALVGRLAAAGMQGIEVHFSQHSREQQEAFGALARDFGIVATGGTDFHGTANPDIEMGRGFGGLRVPDDIVAQLESRLAARRPA